MANKTLNMVFKAVDNVSTAFDKITNAGKKTISTVEETNTASASSYTTVSDAANSTASSMSQASERTEQYMNRLDSLGETTADTATDVENLDKASQSVDEALDEVSNAADKAGKEVEDYGEKSEESGEKSERFGEKGKKAIAMVATALVSVGLVAGLQSVAEAFSDCSAAASAYETQVAKVTTVADTTVKSSSELSSEIKVLSKDTAVGVNDLADATYNAISASVDTADAVMFAGEANQLAVGGFTSSATAVDVLTTAINAYGLETEEATQLSDYLITTQNLGKTTVDQLAQSVGRVIPTAAAYGVQMDNLSTAYATLTANGVATAESTTYLKGMLNELAKEGSTVSDVLYQKTGKGFADLMEEGQSLGDVMQILGDSVNGNSTAFANLWSSQEAATGALSIYNSGAEHYNEVLGKMQSSTGAATEAYETMTSTTEYATQSMNNSFDNLSIAFGEKLNPAVAGVENTISTVVDGFTNIVEECPAVAGVVTGLTLSMGTLTAVVVGYNAVMKVAPILTGAFSTALTFLEAHPVIMAVTAVTALVAGIAGFVAVAGEAEDATEQLTATSQKQADEIAELSQKYDEACDKYGKNSDEARELNGELIMLQQQFDSNKQTVAEYNEEMDSVMQSYDDMVKKHDEAIKSIDTETNNTLSLIERLDTLTSATSLSAAEQQELLTIVDMLNNSIPGLALSYDKVTNSVGKSKEAILAAAKEQAKSQKYAEYEEKLADAYNSEEELATAKAKAMEEQAAAQEKYNKALEEYNNSPKHDSDYTWIDLLTGKLPEYEQKLKDAEDELENANNAVDEATKKYEDNEKAIEDTANEMAKMNDTTSELTGETKDADTILTSAVGNIKGEIGDLAIAYDNAYQSARDSIDGQIGLFDEMTTQSDISVNQMQSNMESQLEYLNTYSDNLEKASEIGLDKNLIAELSDGSEESAGRLNAIIQEYEKLGKGSKEAKEYIESFNKSYKSVEEAKDKFATTSAEIETDWDKKWDGIVDTTSKSIDEMDLSEKAAAAARNTLESYINEIKKQTPKVGSAVDAVNNQLGKIGVSVTSENDSGETNTEAHAEGGIFDEPHWGVFAEEGPEAFIPIDGSQNAIDIWKDTGKLLGQLDDSPENKVIGPSIQPQATESRSSGDKIVTIKLEGAGELKIRGSNLNKEQVLKVLQDNLKPALLKIISQEVLEEGDGAYEF